MNIKEKLRKHFYPQISGTVTYSSDYDKKVEITIKETIAIFKEFIETMELPENPLDKARLVDNSRLVYQLDDFCFTDAYKRDYSTGFQYAQQDLIKAIIKELNNVA